MKNILALAIPLSLVLVASPLAGQDGMDPPRWSIDLQAGVAVPTTEIAGDDLGTGFGFEGNVAYRFARHVAVYAGWDWHRFAPDELLGQPDLDLEETGYVLGLRFDHPFRGEVGNGPSYRLRGGVTLNHIELEDADGEAIDDSGHGVGFEVGAGVMLPLGERFRFGPEVRYRWLGRELDVGTGATDVDLNYFAFDLVFSLGL